MSGATKSQCRRMAGPPTCPYMVAPASAVRALMDTNCSSSISNRERSSATSTFGHGVRPHLPVFDPASGLLYVTTELDNSVTIIDPKTWKILGAVPTGQEQSHMLVLSHDGRRGYTANVGPGTVSVLDLEARRTLAVIPVAKTVQRISISNDDKLVFTSDQSSPRLAVIDVASHRVSAWVPLPGTGYGTAATLDGRWLLVAIPAANQVAVRRSEHFASGAQHRCPENPAGDSGAPRWQDCLCFVQPQRRGCGHRLIAVESADTDCCGTICRRARLGAMRSLPECPVSAALSAKRPTSR